MREMYTVYNNTIAIINGVFATLVVNTPEEEFMKHTNNASFVLAVGQITADLDHMAMMTEDDIAGYVPVYIENFVTAYKQSFMSSSGFGETTASAYSTQAAAAMAEIIDTYLAMR